MMRAIGPSTAFALGELLCAHVCPAPGPPLISTVLIASRSGIPHRALERAIGDLPTELRQGVVTFERACDSARLRGVSIAWLEELGALDPAQVSAPIRHLAELARQHHGGSICPMP